MSVCRCGAAATVGSDWRVVHSNCRCAVPQAVPVAGMAEAFRRWRQATDELRRLGGYRRLTPGMKDAQKQWQDQRDRAEHYLKHGPG